MRAAGRRRHQPVEADPGLLHAGHAALQRGRRRHPQGQARHRGRQEAARRSRLYRPAGHVRGGAGPADTKAMGDVTADLLKQHRHERRFRRHRLGHGWPAPRARNRRPGRAAGACSTRGTRAPTASIRRPTSRSAPTATRRWFGWPNMPEVEKEVDGLVRGQEPRRGEGGDRAPQQGGDRQRRLRADRLLPTAIRPGARTSAASSKARCRSSGASPRPHEAVRSRPCSLTSSGASWRPSRSWRSSRCSCSACSTSRRAIRPR